MVSRCVRNLTAPRTFAALTGAFESAPARRSDLTDKEKTTTTADSRDRKQQNCLPRGISLLTSQRPT